MLVKLMPEKRSALTINCIQKGIRVNFLKAFIVFHFEFGSQYDCSVRPSWHCKDLSQKCLNIGLLHFQFLL